MNAIQIRNHEKIILKNHTQNAVKKEIQVKINQSKKDYLNTTENEFPLKMQDPTRRSSVKILPLQTKRLSMATSNIQEPQTAVPKLNMDDLQENTSAMDLLENQSAPVKQKTQGLQKTNVSDSFQKLSDQESQGSLPRKINSLSPEKRKILVREQQKMIDLRKENTVNLSNEDTNTSAQTILQKGPGSLSFRTQGRIRSMGSNIFTNQDTFKTGRDTDDSKQASSDDYQPLPLNSEFKFKLIDKELSLIDEHENSNGAYQTTRSKDNFAPEQKESKPQLVSSQFKNPDNPIRKKMIEVEKQKELAA